MNRLIPAPPASRRRRPRPFSSSGSGQSAAQSCGCPHCRTERSECCPPRLIVVTPFSFSNPTVPHRESPIQFSKRPSRIGKPCFDFQSPRPASGQPFLFFIDPFPHRDSHFNFSLAFSRIGIAAFNYRWSFPISGQRFFNAKLRKIIRFATAMNTFLLKSHKI